MGQSAAACCLYKRPGLRKKGVGRGGSSSLPQPALSSGLSVTTGRGVRMPLLGDGAGGEPQRLAQASRKRARGLGRVRWPCGEGSGGLFPAVLSLLVLFSEGAGMGREGSPASSPQPQAESSFPRAHTTRSQNPSSPERVPMLRPLEPTPQCGAPAPAAGPGPPAGGSGPLGMSSPPNQDLALPHLGAVQAPGGKAVCGPFPAPGTG